MPAERQKPLDILKKACDKTPRKKVVVLNDGTEFELWHAPLTAAERSRARRDAKSEDASDQALQTLILKALNEDGSRMFSTADAAALRNDVRNDDLQKLMLAVMDVDAEDIDPKS